MTYKDYKLHLLTWRKKHAHISCVRILCTIKRLCAVCIAARMHVLLVRRCWRLAQHTGWHARRPETHWPYLFIPTSKSKSPKKRKTQRGIDILPLEKTETQWGPWWYLRRQEHTSAGWWFALGCCNCFRNKIIRYPRGALLLMRTLWLLACEDGMVLRWGREALRGDRRVCWWPPPECCCAWLAHDCVRSLLWNI